MQPDLGVSAIAHVIQLAIAPVFLLTGIAAVLGVLTNRLGRIIDRARRLEDSVLDLTGEHHKVMSADLRMLSRRATLMHRAISLCTVAALLVCVMIAVLFVSAFFGPDVSAVVATFFVFTMMALISGLLSFLREVQLATRSLRIGPH